MRSNLNESVPANEEAKLPWAMRSFEVWLLIAAAESVHGALRNALMAPLLGDLKARQIAVFTGSAIVLGIAFIFHDWMRARTTRSQLSAGMIWVGFTVAFELGLGRLVIGLSWERILSDYDLAKGGLMPIGLSIMFFAPAIAARLRRGHTAYGQQTASDRT